MARSFANEAEIHGVGPLLRSRSKHERLVWTVVLVVALSAVCRGVVRTVQEYYRQPVITKMSFKELKKFPSFMICPPYWVNETKARQLNMTFEDYRSMADILGTPAEFRWVNRDENTSGHVARFVEKFGNYMVDDLFRQLTVSPFVYVDSPYDVEHRFQRSQVLSANLGPCELMESFLEIEDMLDHDELSVYAIVQKVPYAFNFVHPKHPPFSTIYFGDTLIAADYRSGALLGSSHVNYVKIAATWLSLSPWRKNGCSKDGTERERHECFANASIAACHMVAGGGLYMPGHGQTVRDILPGKCALNAKGPHAVAVQRRLQSICKAPCKKWTFDATVSSLDQATTAMDWDGLILHVTTPSASKSIEEFFATTRDGFVSNLGGQISLYTGASVIALLQVLIFTVFSRQVKVEKQEKSDGRKEPDIISVVNLDNKTE